MSLKVVIFSFAATVADIGLIDASLNEDPPGFRSCESRLNRCFGVLCVGKVPYNAKLLY